MLERLADMAAQKLGIDRAEIRRRNLIPPRRCRTRRRSVRPTTAATFPRSSRARWRSPTTTASRSAGARPSAAGGCAASASPATSNRRASRPRASPARSARASASTRRPRSGSSPTARCAPCSAPTITARATPPPSRRSWRRSWASPVENIEVSEGDTDAVPYGTGTFGSRSIAVGGCALDRAGDKIIAKGKLIAGASAGGGRGRRRFRRRLVRRRRHRPPRLVRGGRARRLCPAQLSARDARAGAAGDRGLRSAELRLQQRRPCVRARDRSADRPHRDRRLLGRRRRRHRHQPDDRRGPDPRRRRAGPRPGAVRALRL